jgi:hypothetical protein
VLEQCFGKLGHLLDSHIDLLVHAEFLDSSSRIGVQLILRLFFLLTSRVNGKGQLYLRATVPYEAVKMNRKGKGVELNPDYFRDGVGYLESADAEKDAPTLFDLLENGA